MPRPSLSAFDEEVRRNLPRNYAAQLVHGMLAMTGFRLVNAPTFVPAYLFLLSGSNVLVGLAMSAQHFAAFASSIFGAVAVEHRARVLPLGIFYGWMMRLAILGLALSGFFLPLSWTLPVFVIFLAALGIFGGMQNVVFNILMVKTIPADRRGFLTGLRFFLGGLTAAAVAWIGGRYLVEGNALGNGYATTFLVAFVLTALGLALLGMVKEPASQDLRARSSARSRFREIPAFLRQDASFAKFFWAQSLATLGMMAAPFYVLSAAASLGLSGQLLGDMSFALLLAITTAHLGWGWLGDRTGFKPVLIAALTLWALGALLLALASSQTMAFLAFLALGSGMAGYQLGTQNLAYAFGTGADMPLRLALVSASQAFVQGIGAILGGIIASGWFFPESAYFVLLCTAIVMKLAAAAILWLTRIGQGATALGDKSAPASPGADEM